MFRFIKFKGVRLLSTSPAARKTIIGLAVMTIAAAVFVLFFSVTTSPFYEYVIFNDSAMFQTIGRGWAEGVLPYVRLWDSKGPMIFLLNALGYMLTGTRFGICILQIAFMALTACVFFRWLSSVYSFRASLLLALAVLVGVSLNYDFGNLTEEYLLPLLALSFYFFHQWILLASEGRYPHPSSYSFIYGLTLGFSLMTRATNAIGVCVGVLFVFIILVKHKMWACILRNAATFSTGFLLMVIPFAMYFHLHGALGEMWYATVTYNLSYAAQSPSSLSLQSLLHSVFAYAFCLLLAFAALFTIRKGRFLQGTFWLSVSFATFAYLCLSYRFFHYGLISVPYLCAFFVLLKDLKVPIANAALCVSCAFLIFIFTRRTLFIRKGLAAEYGQFIQMADCIPDSGKDSFVAYNCYAGLYILTDIRPACRFFAVQDWAASNAPTLKKMLIHDFSKCNAQWILVHGDIATSEIGGIIRRDYSLVSKQPDEGYSLYRRNE